VIENKVYFRPSAIPRHACEQPEPREKNYSGEVMYFYFYSLLLLVHHYNIFFLSVLTKIPTWEKVGASQIDHSEMNQARIVVSLEQSEDNLYTYFMSKKWTKEVPAGLKLPCVQWSLSCYVVRCKIIFLMRNDESF
jgi:hypothetical protein